MSQQTSIDFLVAGLGMQFKIGAPIINQAGGRIVGILGQTDEEAEAILADPEIRLPALAWAGNLGDYNRIISLPMSPVDAVFLAVPNYLHAQMGIDAAQAGKHILIEKPLATNPEDAKRFLDEVVKSGVAVEINSQYRHHEVLDKALRKLINQKLTEEDGYLKAVIGGEDLGKPTYVKMQYLQGWMAKKTDAIGWRPEVAVAGKGKLVGDLGVHCMITTMDLFDGSFQEFDGRTYILHEKRYKPKVATESFTNVGEPTADELAKNWIEMDMTGDKYSGDDKAAASFILRTAKGIKIPGTYELSQVESGKLNDPMGNDFMIEVGFEKGKVFWYQWDPNHLVITNKEGKNPKVYERPGFPSKFSRPGRHPAGIGDAMGIGIDKMLKMIEGGDTEAIRAYTRRNAGFGYDAQVKIADWVQKPLKPVAEYVAPTLPSVKG